MSDGVARQEVGDPGVTYEEQELEVVVNDYLEEAFDGAPDVQALDASVLATGIVREVVRRRAEITAYEAKVRAGQQGQDVFIEMFNAITDALDPEGTDEFRGDTVDAVLTAIADSGYVVHRDHHAPVEAANTGGSIQAKIDAVAIAAEVIRELAGTLEIAPYEVRVVMQHIDKFRAARTSEEAGW